MSITKHTPMNAWDILRENALQILMYIIGAVITALIAWPLAVLYVATACSRTFSTWRGYVRIVDITH